MQYDRLYDLADKAVRAGEILLWNHVVHSWIDPLFQAGCIFAAVYGLVKVCRWVASNA